MVNVIASYAGGMVGKDKVRMLFDYPHPNRFFNLGFRPAPAHGLYLHDCVYDPEQFLNPVPIMPHNWDRIENLDKASKENDLSEEQIEL